MSKRFYIVNWVFSYGSASSNRLLAYANSAAEQGIDVHIVALLRLDLKNCTSNSGVKIRGLLPCYIKNKLMSRVLSFFTTVWFLITEVRKNDRILLYGSAEYLPLFVLIRRKQTFFEVTECPELFKPQTYTWRSYIRLWKHLNGIFVISNNLKEYFEDHGVLPDRVHVINIIVEHNRFEGVARKNLDEKYIAYCGNINIDAKDGVKDLIASFIRYKQIFTDRKLYIIGPIVASDTKKEYENFVEKMNAVGSVVFIGSVSPVDIPQYLVNAEMLVLARPNNIQSKYGFPTKLGEYLLSGRPVVVTAVGNVVDYLVDGKSAYIARPGDVLSISEKMIKVSSNPEQSEIVALEGKKVAIEKFNSTSETSRLLSIIFQ